MIKQWEVNNITVIYANATAIATITKAKAEAEAFKIELEGYAEAFQSLQE